MLTPTKKLYTEICAYRIANPKATIQDTATHFDIASRTVDTAIAWGRKNDAFRQAASERIEYHIQEYRAHIKWLESEIKLISAKNLKKRNKKGVEIIYRPSFLIGLSKELRETRIILMELEGLYRKVLNIQLSNLGGPLRVQYELVEPDETDQD